MTPPTLEEAWLAFAKRNKHHDTHATRHGFRAGWFAHAAAPPPPAPAGLGVTAERERMITETIEQVLAYDKHYDPAQPDKHFTPEEAAHAILFALFGQKGDGK